MVFRLSGGTKGRGETARLRSQAGGNLRRGRQRRTERQLSWIWEAVQRAYTRKVSLAFFFFFFLHPI